MKVRIICTLLAACMVCVPTACGKKGISADKELPVETMEGCYILDVDDPVALISSADYAFVANVVKDNGCEYEETGDRPHTNYDVRVVKNLKGELTTDMDIPIMKRGGISADGSCYEIYENDFLPKEGDTCIFTAYATEDGELSVSGEGSTELLSVPEDFMAAIEAGDTLLEETLKKNEVYNEYVSALDNLRPAREVETPPIEHYVSRYE